MPDLDSLLLHSLNPELTYHFYKHQTTPTTYTLAIYTLLDHTCLDTWTIDAQVDLDAILIAHMREKPLPPKGEKKST